MTELPQEKQEARHRILIVEDVATMRRILSKILESAGYIIEQAENGAKAAMVIAELIREVKKS